MAGKFGISAQVKVDVAGIHLLSTEAKKRNISFAGAKAGAKILKTAAKGAAPIRKGGGGGSLKKAQSVKVARGKKGLTVAYAVQGAVKKFERMVRLKGRNKAVRVVPAFYDHLVQLGTRPHALGKGESLGREATKRRKTVVRTAQTSGKHPGTRGYPYRKYAWASVKDEAGRAAVDAMSLAVRKAIAKAAAKIAAAGGK